MERKLVQLGDDFVDVISLEYGVLLVCKKGGKFLCDMVWIPEEEPPLKGGFRTGLLLTKAYGENKKKAFEAAQGVLEAVASKALEFALGLGASMSDAVKEVVGDVETYPVVKGTEEPQAQQGVEVGALPAEVQAEEPSQQPAEVQQALAQQLQEPPQKIPQAQDLAEPLQETPKDMAQTPGFQGPPQETLQETPQAQETASEEVMEALKGIEGLDKM